MPLDPQVLTAAFYAVLETDAAGAAVRAALAAGATSIVPARQLNRDSLPAAPFLALRPGVINGARYQVRSAFFTWWVYDDPIQEYWRINGILPLIEAAYPKEALPFYSTELVSIGQEIPDESLNRLTRSIQWVVRTRR